MKTIINRSCLMLFAALMFVVTMSSCHPDEPKSKAAKDAKSEAKFVSKKIFGQPVEDAKKALVDAGFEEQELGLLYAPKRANSKLRRAVSQRAVYVKEFAENEMEVVQYYEKDGVVDEALVYWVFSGDACQLEDCQDRAIMLNKFAENWVNPLGAFIGMIGVDNDREKQYMEDNVGDLLKEKDEMIKDLDDRFAAGLLTKQEYDEYMAEIEEEFGYLSKEQFYQDIRTPFKKYIWVESQIASVDACNKKGLFASVAYEAEPDEYTSEQECYVGIAFANESL